MATVRLRPLTVDDLGPLWESRRADESGFPARVGPEARDRLRERLEKNLTLEHDGWLELGVEVGGRLVGDLQARHPKNAMPDGVYEIGVTLFAGDRGKGVGRQAVELFTDLLFAEHEAARVQASTALDNGAMRRVFELLGWSYEGVMRSFAPSRRGGREDYALYAITRDDWESRNSSRSADT